MQEIENIIGYKFKNKSLLDLALTHSSYVQKSNELNNERLEFLGDAVLELSVSEFLYKNYKDMSEGELSRFRSKIVCETSLALIAKKNRIGNYLKLSRGEETSGGRNKNSILSDAMEAIFGAVFIDSNFSKAKAVVFNLLNSTKGILDKNNIIDPKSHLQELLQEKSAQPIIYKIIDESGPAHKKTYVSQVSHEGKILGHGSGHTKKDSEQQAALQAIKNL